jgi:curved DNA-binding protein CbpA
MDLYNRLNLDITASSDEIKTSFRKLLLTTFLEENDEKLKKIIEAYLILNDQTRRQQYDYTGSIYEKMNYDLKQILKEELLDEFGWLKILYNYFLVTKIEIEKYRKNPSFDYIPTSIYRLTMKEFKETYPNERKSPSIFFTERKLNELKKNIIEKTIDNDTLKFEKVLPENSYNDFNTLCKNINKITINQDEKEKEKEIKPKIKVRIKLKTTEENKKEENKKEENKKEENKKIKPRIKINIKK